MQERDAELVANAKQGDLQAFHTIYELYGVKIFTYISYRVYDVETAEDLTAEVFVRVVDKIDRYEYRGLPLLAWLYTIAGNLVRDYIRLQERSPQTAPLMDEMDGGEMLNPEKTVDHSLQSAKLVEAIHLLTTEQAEVILLKFVEGYSNHEIAQILGKNEGSIKSLQFRALQSLKKILVGFGIV